MRQLLLTILFSIIYFVGNAQLNINVNSCYEHSEGSYSEYYYREVVFMTGSSLNKASDTQDYDKEKDYAVIWFNQDEVVFIRLDKQILEGLSRYLYNIDKFSFDFYCRLHDNLLTGIDKEGRKWKICTLPKNFVPLCK